MNDLCSTFWLIMCKYGVLLVCSSSDDDDEVEDADDVDGVGVDGILFWGIIGVEEGFGWFCCYALCLAVTSG